MPQSSKYCTRHGIERNALTRICIQNSPLIGLLVDEVNESDMTDERIEEWIATLGI